MRYGKLALVLVAGLVLTVQADDIKSGPKSKIGGPFDVKAITGERKGDELCYVCKYNGEARPGVVLNREQLLDITAGRGVQVFDRSIDNLVSRLRRRIERDPQQPTLIKTIWGDGYTFAAAVEGAP